MLSEVVEIFSGGIWIIAVVLSLFGGIERFLEGGGEIVSGLLKLFQMHGKVF